MTTLKAARHDAASATTSGFVGSWIATFFEADGPPTRVLATFGADGTLVASEHPVVTPPVANGVVFTSSAHGAWQQTGARAAVFTAVGLGSYSDGTLFGSATARATITLDASGNTTSGDIVWTVADASGQTLATFPGTFQATRIVAEGSDQTT